MLDDKWTKIFEDGVKKSSLVAARDQIKPEVALPTIFESFNWATMIGGVPLKRIFTITGPTSHGKTGFVLGLARSFLDRGLPVLYIDAERSLEKDFVEIILGGPVSSFPHLFVPEDMRYYRHAVAATDEFMAKVRDWRDQCETEEERARFGGLVIVDSITKLAPESEIGDVLGTTLTQGKATDAAKALEKGRAGQRRANTNQTWLDRLTGQANYSNCSVAVIAQERRYLDGMGRERYKPKGGDALLYDASLVIRVRKAGATGRRMNGKILVAQEHLIEITKSKVARLDEGYKSVASYWWSTGDGEVPMGLDPLRDLFETAKTAGAIVAAGSWYSFDDVKLQGDKFYSAMVADSDLARRVKERLDVVERESRSMRRGIPGEIDERTGEVV
jgi:RecA/RadA recombinase